MPGFRGAKVKTHVIVAALVLFVISCAGAEAQVTRVTVWVYCSASGITPFVPGEIKTSADYALAYSLVFSIKALGKGTGSPEFATVSTAWNNNVKLSGVVGPGTKYSEGGSGWCFPFDTQAEAQNSLASGLNKLTHPDAGQIGTTPIPTNWEWKSGAKF